MEKVLETSLDDERRVVRKFASYAINVWSMINWIIIIIIFIYYNGSKPQENNKVTKFIYFGQKFLKYV